MSWTLTRAESESTSLSKAVFNFPKHWRSNNNFSHQWVHQSTSPPSRSRWDMEDGRCTGCSECVLCAVLFSLIYGKIADPGFNYLLRVNQEVVWTDVTLWQNCGQLQTHQIYCLEDEITIFSGCSFIIFCFQNSINDLVLQKFIDIVAKIFCCGNNKPSWFGDNTILCPPGCWEHSQGPELWMPLVIPLLTRNIWLK